MNREETNNLMTVLELRRENAKLKAELKRKDKLIYRLEEKIEMMKRR